jgi:hypothetical protein
VEIGGFRGPKLRRLLRRRGAIICIFLSLIFLLKKAYNSAAFEGIDRQKGEIVEGI